MAGRLRTLHRHGVVDLSGLGAASLGVWTRRQALAVLSGGQIDAFVRARVWQVVWRGVYADAGHDLDAEQRAWAAVLAAGGAPTVGPTGRPRLRAIASGRTAARVWGLPLIDDDDPATGGADWRLEDVSVGRHLPQQHREDRTLVPHRSRLGREEVVRLSSGLWVTAPARTLLDCAVLLTAQALVCATDGALHRHLVQHEDLRRVHPARPGAARLRTAVGLADARAESPPETLARLLLLPVLPELEPQVELVDHAARLIARFDLGDRSARLAVEADGKAGHAGPVMVAKDRRRDRRSEAYGWHTERVTWFELRREEAAFVRRVTGVHASLTSRSAP